MLHFAIAFWKNQILFNFYSSYATKEFYCSEIYQNSAVQHPCFANWPMELSDWLQQYLFHSFQIILNIAGYQLVPSVEFRYSRFVLLSECHEWSATLTSAFLSRISHAAAFVMNAALVASQWQHNEWIISTHYHFRARGWTGRKYRFPSLR